jgi:site-specific recombinase XerD
MEIRGLSDYSIEVGEEYLSVITRGVAPSTKRARQRSIRMLSEYLETGHVRRRIVHLVEHPLSGEIGRLAQEYLDGMRRMRKNELTILNHRRMLSYFITGLQLKGVTKAEDISEQDILDFVGSTTVAKDHHYYTIKAFSRFLYEKKHTQQNFSYVVERNNLPHHEKLPSVYSAEEVRQIEKSVEQSCYTGKRDYAILLLASRLGLRVSDIANLTFDNIDWDNDKIVLRQAKTGRPVELPLIRDVGEAIVNYLRYARPVSSLPNIFMTACAPYRPMTRISLNGVISRIMQGSGVDLTSRKFGPHSMRHSLASNLLKSGASISIISEALGHESSHTTMGYLRIDINSLKKCVLEVPTVADYFYNQKGGAFYD